MRMKNKQNYCKIKYKGICFLQCKDYRNGSCPGFYSTIILHNNSINIPLYNEFIDNYYKDIIMEIKKKGYITKQEIFQILKEKYKLNFSKRNLQFYISEKLIEPGIMERFPGISGSVSFYREKIPLFIFGIKELLRKHNLTLKEIKKYKNLVYEFNQDSLADYLCFDYSKKISNLEQTKFMTALEYFAFAEAGIKYSRKKFLPVHKSTIIDKVEEIRVVLKELPPGIIKVYSLDDLKTIKEVIFKKDGLIEVTDN